MAKMMKSERDERDLKIAARYRASGCAESIAKSYGLSVASVYAITKKLKVARWTDRGTSKLKEDPAQLKLDPEAYILVARKLTKSYRKAQQWLDNAKFMDRYPLSQRHTPAACGVTMSRVLKATQELAKINATLCTVAPYKVMFSDNKYLELTHQQYVVFLAHPFFYILEHKDERRTIPC